MFKDLYSQEAKVLEENFVSLEIPAASDKIINFASGVPDPRTIPVKDIEAVTIEVFKRYGYNSLQYAPSTGFASLIDEISRFVYRTRGLKTNSDNTIVVSGSQQGLDLISRIFIDPGDIVVVEEPSYVLALNVFRLRRVRFVAIPVDDKGMKVEMLEDAIKRYGREGKRIKLVYTMPIAQNPTGTTMCEERRKYLLELAERYNFVIVEDDAYGLLTFEEEAPKPIASIDKSGSVVYLSSFSKILAPGLRMGYIIVGDDETAKKMHIMKQFMDLGTSTLSQLIVETALKKGVVDKAIEYAKSLYRLKRDIMIELIDEELSDGVSRTSPKGGFYTWLKLNRDVDTEKILELSRKRGVIFTPGKRFCINEDKCLDAMRLSYSNPSENDIRIGIHILADVLREVL
ncbi:MAG: PLP-dependent aminotransferase family protein [Ignisphaera sp.]